MGTHPIFESDFDCLTEMEGLEPHGAEDFFDKLSDDENDRMDGVDEAIEVPEKKKTKPKPKTTTSNRIVLNKRLLTGNKGLVKYLSYFKGMELSKEKDSEYKNLTTLMARLERWTHQLYPKWQLDTTLAKIEKLGKKSMVKNTINRIRTNEVTDELDGMNLPETVDRRGSDNETAAPTVPDVDPSFPTFSTADDAFDKIMQSSS